MQHLATLGLIVRAVPAPSSRRWGWTDPTTGKRRGGRRSTVYTLTGDASREPRPVATIGAAAEPSAEIVEAITRVEAAHAAALARLDAPELLWSGVDTTVDLAVEAVDLAVDTTVDLAVEAPAVAELELSPAAAVEPPAAVLADTYPRGPFVVPVDRQRLPPKSPRRTQSARARATVTAPSSPPSPWLVLSAAAIARTTNPRSPVRAVEPPRPAIVRAVDPELPQAATAATQRTPDGLPPELIQRLRGLVSRRR